MLCCYNKMMQNLRELNIFQLYKRLPFIIYKSKYLIPQRPISPNNLNDLSKNIEETMTNYKLQQFIRKKLKRVDVRSINMQNNVATHDVKQLSHDALLSAYISLYIMPSKQVSKIQLAQLFYEDNIKERLKNHFDGSCADSTAIKSSNIPFWKLPQKEKQNYSAIMAQIISYHDNRMFTLYKELFKIPSQKYVNPQTLFIKQLATTKKTKLKNSNLIQAQKNKYIQKSKKLMQKNKLTLSSFLKEFNLSFSHFSAIKTLCQKVIRCQVLYKELMSNKKQQPKILKKHKVTKQQNLILQEFQNNQNYIKQISEESLKVYEELLSIDPEPIVQPKKKKLMQLERQLILECQRYIEKNTIKTASLANKKQTTKQVKQEKIKKAKVQQMQSEPIQVEYPKFNKSIEKTKKTEVSSAKDLNLQFQQSSLLLDNMGDLQDLAFQLRDQNLDDLDILDEDYQVLKLQRLIAKAGKPKIPAKKINN